MKRRKLPAHPDLSPTLAEAAFHDERALVGGCLIFPEQFGRVRDLVAFSDFNSSECAETWAVLAELNAECEPWDLATVQAGLYRRGFSNPHEILARLTEGILGTDLVRAARRVRSWALRWRVMAQLESACTHLRDPKADPLECARSMKQKVSGLLEGHERTRAILPSSFDPATTLEPGSGVLDDLKAFSLRFVRLTDTQASAIALWIVHTHALDATDVTPYLSITSAEKQSGKTRTLEVLEQLVSNPWMTGKITAAVLARKIHADAPTLLFDECDATFKGDKEFAETLRGVLNSGHRRGGRVSVCVGKGADIKPADFTVFCPKAIAGIGKLPDTVADRAIPIRLKRKAPGEDVERFRRKLIEEEARRLAGRVSAWASTHLEQLQAAQPELPAALTDRQQDGAEPLLAIADLAGGNWPQKARVALTELFGGGRADCGSTGVRLLADIHNVFNDRGGDNVVSKDLVAALAEVEGAPWAEFQQGRPLTANSLARLLKPFDISPRNLRVDGQAVLKGYPRYAFIDAWKRYLPDLCPDPPCATATTLQATKTTTELQVSQPLQERFVPSAANDDCQLEGSGVAAVAVPDNSEPMRWVTHAHPQPLSGPGCVGREV